MSMATEGPAPVWTAPGPDQAQRSLPEILNEALSIIGQDRVLSPDEMKAVAMFQAGLQTIAEGQMAAQGADPGLGQIGPNGEAEDFGAPPEGSAESAEYMNESSEPFTG